VQPKAIDFAEKHQLCFVVSSIGSFRVTEVGPYEDRVAVSDPAHRRLRIALLGCGTVGGGVYQRLTALPELFDVVGVGTRNVDRAIDEDVPVRLITTHLHELVGEPADVVVELLGGLEPARTLVTNAMTLNRDVVTANKALLANGIDDLQNIATGRGVSLRYSAAVGGVAPALETVRRARTFGPLSSVSGVLNGTTNFVLDELARGGAFSEVIRIAQRLGYAEADPQFDLDGTDSAQKLILLAREAFDVDLPFASIRREGISAINASTLEDASNREKKLRLIAECRRSGHGVEGSVTLVELPANHPFAQVEGVSNRLLIQSATGRAWNVLGRGAGRWPTTEAVIADLIDLSCASYADATIEEAEECVA
jgi:homoserine dehydrogenase